MDSESYSRRRGGSGLGWFYLGALLGAVLSAGAVIVATELKEAHGLRRLRRRRGMSDHEMYARDMDIVEGLTHVVSEGFGAMADAVTKLSNGFSSQRQEQIRYGLETDDAAEGHAASEHGWYYADEDEIAGDNADWSGAPLRATDDEVGSAPPLPG